MEEIEGEPAEGFLAAPARDAIAAAVRAAGGCEVFFLGRADESGLLIVEVEDFCRGNAHAVPVLRRIARGWDVAIHNHPSGNLLPSDADLAVAAELGDMGLAFFIVTNDARRVNPVVKIFQKVAPPPALDGAAVARVFGPDGAIAGALEGYESRPEQARMAQAVADALSRSRIVAIEAGTGTGKSLAYLVPALLRATRARERVVVSTNTINLQEQLVRKDIPLLRETWRGVSGDESSDAGPRVALMKGRSNYVCLRKVEDLEGAPYALFEDDEEAVAVGELSAWARRTTEGTREELAAPPPFSAWEKVSVDPDACSRTACRHYQSCFYFKARREAAAADLVVVNHHLLLADLALRRRLGFRGAAVLPPYRHLVIDEAHHLEEVASEHFGAHVTSAGLRHLVGRLQAARRPDRGLLPALLAQTMDEEVARAIEERAIPARRRIDARVEAAFEQAARLVTTLGRRAGDEAEDGAAAVRLRPEHLEMEEWQAFAAAVRELSQALDLLAGEIAAVAKRLESASGAEGETPLLLELKSLGLRAQHAASSVASFVEKDGEGPPVVKWIERKRGRREPIVALRSAPLAVGEALAEDVYPHLDGVVMTSATLAVGGSFDYLAARTGLDRLERGRLATLAIESPFEYERQAVLAIPTDLPAPGERGFEEASAAALLAAARASGGRAFFLFTSYRALERAHRRLEAPLRALGILPLRQGEATRRRLLERFRQEAPAALFATDSFWEGVDVRGGALRLVAIARLPFKVPTEPLQEARAEAIAQEGGDPFRDLAVPQAVLKLKQGFGRLVRSRADRGAILVLDGRVLTKAYGRLFIDSLPPARRVRGPMEELLPHIRELCVP